MCISHSLFAVDKATLRRVYCIQIRKGVIYMATRSSEECDLLLKIEYGSTSSGGTAYRTRTLSNINPELDDSAAYSIMTKFGGLQSHTVAAITRRDSAILTA